jgi:hypothetical protein
MQKHNENVSMSINEQMQRRINCDGLLDCIFLGCDGGLLACF